MGSVGDAYDNAMAESFFASLERELLGVCPSNRSAKLLKGKLSRISGHV
jgi:hypothetical protein